MFYLILRTFSLKKSFFLTHQHHYKTILSLFFLFLILFENLKKMKYRGNTEETTKR